MMNCDHPKETGVEVPPAPVTPTVSRNHRGDDDSPNQCNRKIMPILPLHNRVLTQVADISWSRLDSRFYKHPHNVRLHSKSDHRKWVIFTNLGERLVTHPPETPFCVIRVQICIGVAELG